MSLPLPLQFGQGFNFSIFYLFSKVHFIYYNINYEICTVWRLVMGGYCLIIDFSKNEICGIIVGVSGPVAQLVRARAS